MPATVRDQAVVLRRFPFSESSLVLRVLSREHGRVHLMARGAYRPRSRYFAVLDLFDTLELEWAARERRELQELRAGALVSRRRFVTTTLAGYRAGLAMLELVDLGSRPGQPDRALFDLLEAGLDRLAPGGLGPDAALVVFELGFLQTLGLAPALASCATCGGPAPPLPGGVRRAAFSAGAGGRLCPACAAEARASGRRVGTLPLDVLDLAARILREGIGGALGEARDADLLLRARDFVERFLDYHLETRPKSHASFLAVPNRNAPVDAR